MPIKPEHRALYPVDWPAISARIRERAANRCEWCGVANGAVGYRDAQGVFHALGGAEMGAADDGDKTIKIVLTVAHLDQDPRNNDTGNLACLCQQCHNRHDAPARARHAAETRRRRIEAQGQGRLM